MVSLACIFIAENMTKVMIGQLMSRMALLAVGVSDYFLYYMYLILS